MQLEPDDIVVVIKANGLVSFFAQDLPETEALLERIQALHTCECAEDICPAWEMPDWRQRLLNGEYDTP